MFDKFLKILLIFLIMLLIYMYIDTNPFISIKLNWEIKLPRADKIVYQADTGPSYYGVGIKYIAVNYKTNKKIKKLNKINWIKQKNIIIENEIFHLLLDEILYPQKLEIDKKYLISFDDEYWYYKKEKNDDIIFIVYFPTAKELYIIEHLS